MSTNARLSGKNITIITVAVCLAIASAPAAVYAATGSFVNITDPVTASKARVTGQGSLFTSPKDAVSGYNGKVDSLGRQLVTGPVSVTGAVGVRPVLGTSFDLSGTSSVSNGVLGNGTTPFPAGTKVAITSLTLTNDTGTIAYLHVEADQVNGGTCGMGGYATVDPKLLDQVALAPGSTTHLTFPYPMVATAPQPFCLGVHDNNGPNVLAQAVGFIG